MQGGLEVTWVNEAHSSKLVLLALEPDAGLFTRRMGFFRTKTGIPDESSGAGLRFSPFEKDEFFLIIPVSFQFSSVLLRAKVTNGLTHPGK